MKFGTFIEVTGGTAVDDLNFLVKARSDDETRHNMLFLYVEEEEDNLIGICTDGKRLHVLRELHPILVDKGVDAGFWHIVKAQKNCVQLAKIIEPSDMVFPGWRKIIPIEKPVLTTEFNGIDIRKIRRETYSKRLVTLFRAFPEATSVNVSFLSDLGITYNYAVKWFGANRVMVFESGKREAYIMPMSMEEY